MSAARQIRERLIDARALCAALGLQMAPRATARQAMVLCPWHDERTPSCSVHLAKGCTLGVKCHSCGETADALGLIARVRGLTDFREVLRVAADLAKAPALVEVDMAGEMPDEPEALSDDTYHRIWNQVADACAPMRSVAPNVCAYLAWRRIGADAEAAGMFGLPSNASNLVASLLTTFERKDLEVAGVLDGGRDALCYRAWPLCIPWRDRFGRITFVQRRRLDERRPRMKYVSLGRSPRAPFGMEQLRDALVHHGPDAEIIFTEGALDACARRRIARAKGERAAILGCYSASSPDVGLPFDLLHGRRVVLALDNDVNGEMACAKIASAIQGVASEIVRERVQGAKDWLAALNGGAA